jgi:hypothetical protein
MMKYKADWAEAYGALWYHLDGGDARQHLPRLLSLPYLRVVQYTPAPCEPPNGPGHRANGCWSKASSGRKPPQPG